MKPIIENGMRIYDVAAFRRSNTRFYGGLLAVAIFAAASYAVTHPLDNPPVTPIAAAKPLAKAASLTPR